MARASENGTAAQPSEAAELEGLRARVRELEQELIEVHAWANTAIATAQAQSYWIDKYHIDLNGLMESPGGKAVRGGIKVGRFFFHRGRATYLRTKWLARRMRL